MKKWTLRLCAAGMVAAGTQFSTGCLSIHHTEHRVVYYDYDYYPDWDVYYDPDEHLYYWREDDHWVSGPVLPSHYELRGHHYEHLRVHQRRPWEDHPVEHPAEQLTTPP